VVQPITGDVGVALFITFVLLACSALVSGSEVAYFSLSPRNIKELQGSSGSQSKKVLALLERPHSLLATILIANNLFNLAIIILSAFIIGELIPLDPDSSRTANILHLLLNVGLVTFVIVVFGDIMPKIYAQSANVSFARMMSGPLMVLRQVFKPLSRLLVSSTRIIERRLGGNNGTSVSLEQLDQAIDISTKEGASKEEIRILKGIVKFGGIGVTQVMTSRLDIVAVDEGSDFDELRRIVRESGYSRLPVYKGIIDRITGILYTKDLLPFLDENARFKWQALIRTPYFVPETKRIENLLREFQTKGTHMAIVIDEYGGTTGIITLEDIMEEIIGEIKDEFDPALEINFQRIDERTYVFEGKTLINDFCKVTGLKADTFDDVIGESDSLAGLLLELTKRIPRVHEKINYQNFTFEVMTASKKQVQSIKVHIGENEEAVA
jgi:gliding motility-associated protein GldE